VYFYLVNNKGDNADNYSLIGGTIVGMVAGIAIGESIQRRHYERTVIIGGRIMLALMFIVGFGLFFTMRNPEAKEI